MPPRAAPAAVLIVAALAAAPAAAAHPDPGQRRCGAAACHGAIARAPAGGSTHAPAAGGDCVACHDATLAGEGDHLLRGAGGPGGDLALCGLCHPDHAAAATDAAVRTAFAEEERDLHGLHVRAAARGRACLGCHAPHAAPQPRLLRVQIPGREGVRIAQRFEELPGGGRCTTRCHAPRTYRDGRR